MANSHYIPQFIIKGFSERPNLYDFESRRVFQKNKRSIFCEPDFYSEELETEMNQKLETPFSRLLNDKLKKEEIRLSRSEVNLVKRYVAVTSIRTMGSEGFSNIIRGFSSNANRYLELAPEDEKKNLLSMRRLSDVSAMSNADLYMFALKRFLINEDSNALINDKEMILELYVWALTYTVSYIAFWDAADGMQFVLTDCGMHSEYEGMRGLIGYDASKCSYLLWLSQHGSDAERYVANQYLSFSQSMYENFDFVPLSSSKLLVLVHPFFKLFFPESLVDANGRPMPESSPRIWPTCMDNLKLFEPPICFYRSESFLPGLRMKSPFDEFVYSHQKLSASETEYINYLMVGNAHNYLAFDSSDSVRNAILMSFYGYARQKSVVKLGQSNKETLIRFLKELENDRLKPLIEYLYGGKMPNIKDMEVVERSFYAIVERQIKDLKENPYVAWYFLDNQAYLKRDDLFEFLGSFEERVAHFKKLAEPLMPKKA